MNKQNGCNSTSGEITPTILILQHHDFDEESATAEKYGVRGLPANWFLTEMGQPIVSIPGYIAPEAMLSLLGEVNQINAGD